MVYRLAVLAALSTATPAFAGDAMPDDFVYLRDVDPTIRQDMRYAGPHNFTGKPVDGYDAPRMCAGAAGGRGAEAGAGRPPRQEPHAQSLRLLPPCPRRRGVRRLGEGAGRSEDQDDLLSQSLQERAVPRLHRHALGPFARRDARPHARSDRSRRRRPRTMPSRAPAPRRKTSRRPTAVWLWAQASTAST